MSPNTSQHPPAVTISVVYEHDVEAGAEALLAVLRRPAPPDTRETDAPETPGVSL